jgi:hypothetical protein
VDVVISAIQRTPLPTILILAGLFFILLGFISKLGGIIEVSTEQKRLTIPIGLLVLTIGLVLIFIPPSIKNTLTDSATDAQNPISHAMSNLEYGINRFAGDYKSSYIGSPEECRDACASEDPCVAFSFVKPGIQGVKAVCWLKSNVPPQTPDSCCVSGIKSR